MQLQPRWTAGAIETAPGGRPTTETVLKPIPSAGARPRGPVAPRPDAEARPRL